MQESNHSRGVITPFKKCESTQHPLMGNKIIRKPNGDTEVDPHGLVGRIDRWKQRIKLSDGSINYAFYEGQISQEASPLVVTFILDLMSGKNMAKGTKRGARSSACLFNYIYRLANVIKLMEELNKKKLLQFTEDDTLKFFNGLRNGTVLSPSGKVITDVKSYAKIFCAFWRWYMRTHRDKNVPDIVSSVDTSNHNKPPWIYFTLQDAIKMADESPSLYYRALILFLFDSGMRAPKELMNVRVKDISPVPDTNYLNVQIRDETSKTFGRKIKLMICSDMLKKYIQTSGKQSHDFLFDKSYNGMTSQIKKLGYKVLGVGKAKYLNNNRLLVTGGITMYDFRHSSVCHYLPIYKSENQMKYRYGWKKADMIHYYSEFMGMRDTITDEDIITGASKTQLEMDLEREKQKVALLQ
ncbi:MAG: hypothetical protein ACMXYC_04625, partial [Candidatus Woesearchaeota archaeon]